MSTGFTPDSVDLSERRRGDPCIVLHADLGNRGGDSASAVRDATARLDEAIGLADAIDLNVEHAEVLTIHKPRPGLLFGKGTVERIGALVPNPDAEDGGIPVIIVDGRLTPVQQRNLERAWHCKVLDRTGLILEIFGARARTREGRLQVELAALSYQRGRLVRSWTHLERQRGGFGFMGGPGETQIETDRRLISQRINRLKRDLADVKRTRALHRKSRRDVPYPVVALVGYTNAGKSTLFNRLASADVTAKNQLFATLDPTMRGIELPSGRMAILSDTVGFVSDLPHELVNAFHATLEEVIEADIVLHVRDVSHVDTDAQKRDVIDVLVQIGIDAETDGRVVEILNKIDLLDDEARRAILNRADLSNAVRVLALSALTGDGCDALFGLLDDHITAGFRIVEVNLGHGEGAAIAWLYDHGEVVGRADTEDGVALTVRLSPADADRFHDRQARSTAV